MFRYAIIFATIALIAGASAVIAKVLFFISLTIFGILLLAGIFITRKLK